MEPPALGSVVPLFTTIHAFFLSWLAHQVLSMEIRLVHGIERKALQGPTHGRLWCGNMVYLRRNLPLGFQFPIYLCHTLENLNLAFRTAKTKASVQSFCFILKLSPLEPMPM